MSMIPPATSESSVTFSLAELAKLEEERMRREERERAEARDRESRARREADARRRAEEEAAIARDAAARAARVRAAAEEQARVEAREKAAADVARIQAEAKARLDAENAQRAHELAVIDVQAKSGRKRLTIALAAVIGLALAGGAAGATVSAQRVAAITQEADRLREGRDALGRERDNAKAAELSSLDRRMAALLARPISAGAEDAKGAAESARKAIDGKAPDHARMRAYGDALDALEARLDTLETLAQLDRRRDDLAAWAADRKRTEALAEVRAASAKARALGTGEAIQAYERSLDLLRGALAHAPAGGAVKIPRDDGPTRVCTPGDPGCGLDGRPLF